MAFIFFVSPCRDYDNIFDTQSAKRILPYDGNFGYPQDMTKWIYTDGNGSVVNFLLDEGVNQDDVTIQCLGKADTSQFTVINHRHWLCKNFVVFSKEVAKCILSDCISVGSMAVAPIYL